MQYLQLDLSCGEAYLDQGDLTDITHTPIQPVLAPNLLPFQPLTNSPVTKSLELQVFIPLGHAKLKILAGLPGWPVPFENGYSVGEKNNTEKTKISSTNINMNQLVTG